jgi:nucleotide-binding universal stress UspA family protein
VVNRILVATDRSESADYAVSWAADMAARYSAELLVLQVLVPPPGGEPPEEAALRAATAGLERFASELAGSRGRARVVVADEPAKGIVDAAAEEGVDVVVVGNVGMSGRKEFLLGNVPNRVSHQARCTVVIVNSADAATERAGLTRFLRRR